MPHSTEGADGCYGTAISFMKVETPVDFDPQDEEKKATLFFSLAAMDHEAVSYTHLDVYKRQDVRIKTL